MLGKIVWKNIIRKPLSSALCICLLLFGVGIITFLLVIQNQLENKFENDLKDVDLVIGAKGSPLQLVLSAIYHLDSPTGNIDLVEAKKIMKNPQVKEAIPLAYGDSYQGYRILGTTNEYINKYNGEIVKGRIFSESMEAILGSAVAKSTSLKVGSVFQGTHGEAQHGHVHEENPYSVVGVLQETGSVLDQLVLCNIESVWKVHSHEDEDNHSDSKGHQSLELDISHDHHHDHHHDHNHDYSTEVETSDSMEITAVLLKFKTKMAALKMPRFINEQTNMQAALPALEINRLFYMIGIGATTIKLIAGGIMLMAGFSVFFVLFSRLRERKYELALMRSVGYRPGQLFMLLIIEGLTFSILAYIFGWLLSRVGIYLLNVQAKNDFNLKFNWGLVGEEAWIFLLTILVGVLASFIPAWKAMKMDVSETLTKK